MADVHSIFISRVEESDYSRSLDDILLVIINEIMIDANPTFLYYPQAYSHSSMERFVLENSISISNAPVYDMVDDGFRLE